MMVWIRERGLRGLMHQHVQELFDGPVDIVADIHGEITALDALLDRLAEMVEAGRAQCVLGNHELNLLRGDRKEGNGWFWPAESDHDVANGKFEESARATDSQRQHFKGWFDTLPVALERPDLRVVHACWHDDAIQRLRGSTVPASQA